MSNKEKAAEEEKARKERKTKLLADITRATEGAQTALTNLSESLPSAEDTDDNAQLARLLDILKDITKVNKTFLKAAQPPVARQESPMEQLLSDEKPQIVTLGSRHFTLEIALTLYRYLEGDLANEDRSGVNSHFPYPTCMTFHHPCYACREMARAHRLIVRMNCKSSCDCCRSLVPDFDPKQVSDPFEEMFAQLRKKIFGSEDRKLVSKVLSCSYRHQRLELVKLPEPNNQGWPREGLPDYDPSRPRMVWFQCPFAESKIQESFPWLIKSFFDYARNNECHYAVLGLVPKSDHGYYLRYGYDFENHPFQGFEKQGKDTAFVDKLRAYGYCHRTNTNRYLYENGEPIPIELHIYKWVGSEPSQPDSQQSPTTPSGSPTKANMKGKDNDNDKGKGKGKSTTDQRSEEEDTPTVKRSPKKPTNSTKKEAARHKSSPTENDASESEEEDTPKSNTKVKRTSSQPKKPTNSTKKEDQVERPNKKLDKQGSDNEDSSEQEPKKTNKKKQTKKDK